MSDVTTRALRLLALLQSRTVWTGPELAEELEVTVRTVRRDVDRLRQMGYPVLTSAGHGGGYQLGAGRELPPLLLGPHEAVAVAVGLRLTAGSGIEGLDAEALRALAALDRILPPSVRSEVSAVSEAMGVVARPVPGARSEVLLALATAVRDGLRIRVDYERRDGERSERRLEPRRVLSVEGHWYLFAWDLGREDWRTFRLDRMHAVHPSTFPITPRPTPDIERAVRESITVAGYPIAATVRVLRPAQEVAGQLSSRTARIEPDGEDACLLHAGAENLRWLAVHLALLGAPIEVIDPPQLLEEIRAIGAWAQEARPGV
ncbi:YafY family protein [Brachybacterium sp. YJGR34]|uniref:helix-turn-helix transcriptional regulator n=1 Tax=Brachybacterium sp. YJGR34 TaxID=2059911 RepID=UPI000E0B5DD8|nr:YafY family protein [Brachybacterium sp. YJGR34]